MTQASNVNKTGESVDNATSNVNNQASKQVEETIHKITLSIIDVPKFPMIPGDFNDFEELTSQIDKALSTALTTHQTELLAKVGEAIKMIPETFEVKIDGEVIEVKKGVGNFKKEVLDQLITLEKETL